MNIKAVSIYGKCSDNHPQRETMLIDLAPRGYKIVCPICDPEKYREAMAFLNGAPLEPTFLEKENPEPEKHDTVKELIKKGLYQELTEMALSMAPTGKYTPLETETPNPQENKMHRPETEQGEPSFSRKQIAEASALEQAARAAQEAGVEDTKSPRSRLYSGEIRLDKPLPPFDPVNHPRHYNRHPSGVECIQITEHFNFNLGNSVKYIWRAGLKGDNLEDLKKARWYLDRELERLGAK